MEGTVEKKEVAGIGGWLSVWLVFYLLFTLGTFLGSIQNKGIAQVVLGATFLLNLFLLYLFVTRKILFKKLIIVCMPIFALLIIIIDGGAIDPASLVGQFIGVGIWVMYFLKSSRVKNTFVN